MADPGQLAVLELGAKAWNKWREENPGVAPKLSYAVPDYIVADLSGADLSDADLHNADLSGAFLVGADLSNADLSNADLGHAHLSDADFSNAKLAYNLFVNNDLSQVKGLETVTHQGPSYLSIDTIYKSRGIIPEEFLRGCGVPESFIVQIPALVAALEPL